jgi:hypothetical protein
VDAVEALATAAMAIFHKVQKSLGNQGAAEQIKRSFSGRA